MYGDHLLHLRSVDGDGPVWALSCHHPPDAYRATLEDGTLDPTNIAHRRA